MTLPKIVVSTTDSVLWSALSDQLIGRCEVIACRSLSDVSNVLKDVVPWGCVFDIRNCSGGGHAEARVIEALQDRYNGIHWMLVAPLPCPEPIERVAVGNGSIWSGIDSLANLLSFLLENLPSPISDQVRANESEAPLAVLSGLTKKFETRTPRTRMMLQDLEIAASHDVTILLIGETGAGKTYLSRLIHEVSPRRNDPFLHVACGALPGELIESELFGHVRGAFTSAHADKEGKFVAAGRGTILLDEIDVLGPDQQVKLLRVIESGEFEAVGSNRTLRSQARLIVASNLDLQPLVQAGRFRPDLYYRLNMLKFEIPPLRHRKPDVIMLAERFVQQLSVRHNVNIKRIDPAYYNALLHYPWPGNVRELENVIQRSVIYCREGILTVEHLPSYVLFGMAGPVNDSSVKLDSISEVSQAETSSLGNQMALTEREIIEQALQQNNFSRTNTARFLGISRVTLYNKMKKYGMK